VIVKKAKFREYIAVYTAFHPLPLLFREEKEQEGETASTGKPVTLMPSAVTFRKKSF